MFSLSVVGLFVSAVGISAQEKSTPLYPLKMRNTWTYNVAGGKIQVKVDKKVNCGNEDCYLLETSAQGKVSATEHVVVKEDGVYRVGVNGLKADTPIKFLALPATKN